MKIMTGGAGAHKSLAEPSSGRSLRRRQFLALTLVGGAALVTSATVANAVDYELETTYLQVGLGGRLAFLPDLHIHSRGERHVEQTLKALERVDADVLVIGGDLVDEETRNLDEADGLLAELGSGERIAVLGNHEYWSSRAAAATATLRIRGFHVLFDEYVTTPVGRVFGYDWRENRRYPELTFEGLVITHDPNAADSVKGGALVLAGHTHGGLSLNGHILYSNSRYARGYYRLGSGTHLYVSRGMGQMSHQLRVWSRPELLVLD